MTDLTCKLLVIGAGPGGYVAAIRAAQLGVETIIVEEAREGGTCLNVGCIPSKALIHIADEFDRLRSYAAGSPIGITATEPAVDCVRAGAWIGSIVERLNSGVRGLLRKSGARTIHGTASFRDGKTVIVKTTDGDVRVRAENIVIATGSEPTPLPTLPFAGDVISSTEALALREVPERLIVVGGGYIGLEIGTAYAKLGSSVTVVEATERILPQFDRVLTTPVIRRLEQLGVKLLTSTTVRSWSKGNLRIADANGHESDLAAGKVLVAIGRQPRTASFANLQLTMDSGFVKVDERCRTSMRGVFAIGDVTGHPMLAHRAMAQGDLVARLVAGRSATWDKNAIPAICFTDPEIVSVGLLPAEAEASGIETLEATFPLKANARSLTQGSAEGLIRVVARTDDERILGVQAVGGNISELSAAFSLALEMGARLEDVAETIHAHPTCGEAFQEACLKAIGLPLHF